MSRFRWLGDEEYFFISSQRIISPFALVRKVESINQNNHTINEWIIETINESIDETIDESINRSTNISHESMRREGVWQGKHIPSPFSCNTLYHTLEAGRHARDCRRPSAIHSKILGAGLMMLGLENRCLLSHTNSISFWRRSTCTNGSARNEFLIYNSSDFVKLANTRYLTKQSALFCEVSHTWSYQNLQTDICFPKHFIDACDILGGGGGEGEGSNIRE